MHFGINKELKGHQVTAQAAYGLEPTAVQLPIALTPEELEAMGIPAKRVERVYRKLAEWAARNPEQNQKEILMQIARGIDSVL